MVVRSTGRAIHHTSKAVHRLVAVAFGLLVVASCLLAVAAWRLAQNPIDLGAWSDRLRGTLVDDTSPIQISFGGVFLAWEGFHKGVDYPLDLRLSDIIIADQAGRRLIAAPAAHLTFSLAGLLLGRVVPRTIEVDHAQVVATREAGGAIDIGGNPVGGDGPGSAAIDLPRIRAQLSRPASSDHGRTHGLFDQLRRAHFRDADVTFVDQESGLVVRSSDMNLDLIRGRAGHIRGLVQAPLSIGGQQTDLAVEADWAVGSDAHLNVKLASFRPADVSALPASVAFMARIDAPVSFGAKIRLDPQFHPNHMSADIRLGPGQIKVARGSVPVRSGVISLSGTPDEITLTQGHFDVGHSSEGNPELVDITGTLAHEADRLSASLTLGVDQIDIADLPRLWPAGIADGSRPWIVKNVTAGIATHGTASFVIEADDTLREIALTQASGDLEGSNATFTWIDNVPPIQEADFHLHLVDPDTLDIGISSARQRIRGGGPDLLIKGGQMRITGLAQRDQAGVIHTRVEGSVASALSLLKEPRLHLLSSHPIALKTAGGDASARLDFQFPLEDKLEIDDVQIHADAHLSKVRLLDIAGGQNLDDGAFDLGVDKDSLSLKGQGTVAAVPVMFDGTMSFDAGPPDQVVQKIAATAQPNGAELDAAGLPVTDFLTGPVPLTVVVIERRNGAGSVAINGDLTLATLAIDPLAWRKPSGNIASASATLLMSHDRLTKIDRIAVRGDGLQLTGSADLAAGRLRRLLLDTIRLGRTQGRGTIRLGSNGQVAVVLQGDQIDLSPKLTEKPSGPDKPDAAPATMPDWTLDASFDHAILANGERADNLLVKATGGGSAISLLDIVGETQENPGRPGAGFAIKIERQAGAKRHLLVEAKDAGRFLRGADAVRGTQSGRLVIDGTLDGLSGVQPLAGTATLDNVVIKRSPALGKLLQAITVYGLVAALRESGMKFSHVVIPFHYDGSNLNLDQAHAYNSSLGLTADGRINLSSGQTALTGTIVPAYFFNSMLGKLPLVGKLFSPEKGGGVFAARFAISGRIDDPDISINPVSALTPGFLRGIFDVPNKVPPGKEPASAPMR